MLGRADQAQRLDLLRTYKISFGRQAVLPSSDAIPVSLLHVTSAQAQPRLLTLLQSWYAGPRWKQATFHVEVTPVTLRIE